MIICHYSLWHSGDTTETETAKENNGNCKNAHIIGDWRRFAEHNTAILHTAVVFVFDFYVKHTEPTI